MKRLISALLAISLTVPFALVGCAGNGGTLSLTKDVAASTPAVAPCDGYSPANEFSLELLKAVLAGNDENPVISPASAYLCLAMVMNGADNATLAEFEKVLGGSLDEVNALSYSLTKQLTDVAGDTILNIANSLWADDDHVTVLDSFVKSVVDYYGADIYEADLPSREALNAINSWVNEKTNGLIPTLHDEPYPDDTVLVLLNTIYMKAKWQRTFDAYSTLDNTFTKDDNTQLIVPFMNAGESYFNYIKTDSSEGVVLPYNDGKTTFIALKPSNGQSVRELASSLGAGSLTEMIAASESTLMNLSLPKFNIAYELYLTKLLEDMGLVSAFTSDADLSLMGTGVDGPLYLSWVFQKVKIIVDEEGTEAAAVTEAVCGECAIAQENKPVELHFDTPFLYAVVDLDSGVPIFMGVMDDPMAE